MATPRLFIHIGLQKTGTSYLQEIFWASQPQLADQGVELVPGSKLAMFRLMLNVRDRYNPEIDPPATAKALERLPQQLRTAAPTALITQESLSTATSEQIQRFLGAITDREVHVVVTLRDLGRQLPSAWQQTLQRGGSQPLRKWLRRIEDPTSGAKGWAPLDVTTILSRWLEHVPAERLHVVTVPPSGSAPNLLLDRFCSVLGVDPGTLTVNPQSRANRGLRAEQAEVLRRVNAELPAEYKRRDLYGDVGKRYFAYQVLGDSKGTPIRLPASQFDWCSRVADGFIEHIRDVGCPVVGDLDDLRPLRSSFTDTAVKVPEAQVSAMATRALAAVLMERMRERQEAARRTVPAPTPRGGRVAAVLRRIRPDA